MSNKPAPRMVSPSLESICIRGKYKVFSSFEEFCNKVEVGLKTQNWFVLEKLNGSVDFEYNFLKHLPKEKEKKLKTLFEKKKEALRNMRMGVPLSLFLTAIEYQRDGTIVEVECHPVMYYQKTQYHKQEFLDYQKEDALIECRRFVKRVMSIVKAKEIQPVSVYPIIDRSEIKDRLLNLGLKEIVNPLDRAEKHIVQNNFEESLKCSRTAFEKMISYQMKKRGMKKTDAIGHDIDRLMKKGFLDEDVANVFRSYYHFLSNIGVHERGVRPGIYEAQLGYGFTLIALDYFADKFL